MATIQAIIQAAPIQTLIGAAPIRVIISGAQGPRGRDATSEVVTGNIEAAFDYQYNVVANAVIDDPSTPVEGKSYNVFVMNGTATVGGEDYSDVGSFIRRYYEDGEWHTQLYRDVTAYATAAQGALADTAVQPSDLGTAAYADTTDFATAAQGALADTAVQPSDLGTAAYADTTDFATAAQGTDERVPTAAGLTSKFSTAKTTPVDNDRVAIFDSAASFAPKHTLWSSIKATLKSYFDTVYAAIVHTHVSADITDASPITESNGGKVLKSRSDGTLGNISVVSASLAYLQVGVSGKDGVAAFSSYGNRLDGTSIAQIYMQRSSTAEVTILVDNLTDIREIQIPDASGTLALTSDITDAVTSNTTSDGTCDLTLSTLVVGIGTASGVRSTALGQSTASGDLSFASGLSSATNDYSFASGDGSTSSGYASFAANNSTASGDQSASFGSATTASGVCSFAAGLNSTASGSASMTVGNGCESAGDGSFSAGLETTSSAEYAFAIGSSTTASGIASFSSGDSTVSSGSGSFAIGLATEASGIFSFAGGSYSTASGVNAYAFGYRANAIYDGSSVESDNQDADVTSTTTDQKTFRFQNGYRFLGGSSVFSAGVTVEGETITETLVVGTGTVSGDYSVAIGSGTIANGLYSFAGGLNSTADGVSSFAFGSAYAPGYGAIAFGSGAVASGDSSFACGLDVQAIHEGSSVEGDSEIGNVATSTAINEKTFRFQNGYRFLGGSVTFDGTVFANHIHGNLAGNVYTHVRAGEALTKGDPVYVSGSHGSGSTLIPIVSKADASNAAKMPAVGIVDADIANDANGHMVIVGTITELNTNAYAINDTLYVASGGGFTATPPAANSQPVARVERSNTNNGAVIVKVNGLASSGGNGASDANKLVRFGSAGTIPVASIGGLGTGVATALGNTANGTGGVVTTNGIATLSNKVLSNCTGYNYTDLSGIQRAIRTSNFSRPVGTYTTAQQADQVLTLNLLANVTYRVKIFAQFVGTGGSQVAGGISAPNSQFATLLVKRSGSFVGQVINTINPWGTFGILATTVNANQLVEVDYIIKPLVNGATSILWNPFAGTGEVSIIAGSYIQAEIIG